MMFSSMRNIASNSSHDKNITIIYLILLIQVANFIIIMNNKT